MLPVDVVGVVTTRHNAMRNVLYTTLHRTGLSAHVEESSSWSIEKPKSHPADILVANWDRGFSAAFDVSVTSSLNPLHILQAGISPGAAAKVTEERKHKNNDAKCADAAFQWWWSLIVVGAQRQGRLCRSWPHDWLFEPTLTNPKC